jgi:hypothetical protein
MVTDQTLNRLVEQLQEILSKLDSDSLSQIQGSLSLNLQGDLFGNLETAGRDINHIYILLNNGSIDPAYVYNLRDIAAQLNQHYVHSQIQVNPKDPAWPTIVRALQDLNHTEYDSRYAAIQTLAGVQHPEVQNLLFQCTEHPLQDVRLYAIFYLARLFGDERMVGKLANILHQTDALISQLAPQVILNLYHSFRVEYQLRKIGDTNLIQYLVVLVLGEIKSASSKQLLIEATHHHIPFIRQTATEILAQYT